MTYQHFELVCGIPETIVSRVSSESMSLSEALEDVFPLDTGLCVMSWNGIFVPLTYKYSVGEILLDALEMIERLAVEKNGDVFDVSFFSNSFHVDWHVTVRGDVVSVDAAWENVIGSLVELLKERSPLTIERSRFVAEWQHLFAVVVRAIGESGVKPEQVQDYDRLAKAAKFRPS